MALEVVTRSEPLDALAGSIVLPVVPEFRLDESISEGERALAEWVMRAARAAGVIGRVGQVAAVPPPAEWHAERIVLVGLGTPEQRTLSDIRRVAALTAKVTTDAGGRILVWPVVGLLRHPIESVVQAIVEGVGLASYRFHRYRSSDTLSGIERLVVAGTGQGVETASRRGQIVYETVNFARDLTNEPGNVLDPERLSGIAWEVAQEVGLQCSIYDRALLEELGAGAILAVGQGSRREPRLVHLVYKPGNGAATRLALVGKAVTFDSGGLSLKPAEGMERMKGDMAGGAVVLSVLRALPALGLPVEVHGIVAAAENLPDGDAFRPGDIVRTLNGKTVEVISTDAEGRLLLADALTYAVQQDAHLLIDVATLTGACAVALGRGGSGLFATDERARDLMLRAASEVGERMWPLPLWDEYRDLLRSEHADLKNTAGRWGAAINAALFLREFTDGRPWLHLDIAGPAWSEQPGPFGPPGATGHGVRTLLRFLELWAESCAGAGGERR
ncbi:leucyl aminopeptidase [Thermomicrobium sp. 4228-Ro]|uniref:leucyl aminopeptidase n=1 Tax=Thermomicrobium sp. 4228-Ro TaxID=2993937 RepID=UPI002248D8F6|nr:leucyl aminopeptidase [Thermomicrobium sp. 4228-Ro]MCX2726348.1 leucyl aminopeptidase [Thermomicrobium sp. 4228-Ro]